MSVSSIRDFNDPFELHLKPGRQGTPAEELQRTKTVAARNHDELIARAILAGHNIRRYRRKLAKVTKKPDLLRGLTDQLIENQRERSIRHFDAATKVMCFSEQRDPESSEIPMWGYYADCHRGVRVHLHPEFYRRPGILVFDIDYEPLPPEVGFAESKLPGLNKFVEKMLRTKAESWSHEEEVRVLVPNRLLKKGPDSRGTNRHWIDLDPSHIARIDLGIQFAEKAATVALLKKEFPTTPVFLTSKHPKEFLCRYTREH
ncbi:MAG: DUF2971 domain-containing protein [Verrucomicrobiota bacterium]